MSETDDPRSTTDSTGSTGSAAHEAASTQPEGAPSSAAKDGSSGAIPPTIAAAIACALPIIGSIIMLVLERNNRFVRFYSLQSLVFGLTWIVLGIAFMIVSVILGFIPIIGWILGLLLGIASAVIFLGFLIVWLVQIFKALTNVEWEIPFLGPIARNIQAGKGPFETGAGN